MSRPRLHACNPTFNEASGRSNDSVGFRHPNLRAASSSGDRFVDRIAAGVRARHIAKPRIRAVFIAVGKRSPRAGRRRVFQSLQDRDLERLEELDGCQLAGDSLPRR